MNTQLDSLIDTIHYAFENLQVGDGLRLYNFPVTVILREEEGLTVADHFKNMTYLPFLIEDDTDFVPWKNVSFYENVSFIP